MNTQKITAKLKSFYPGRKVIVTDPLNPTEIICEVEPTEEHPKWSVAVAVIDSTRLHYHKRLTEIYHIMSGKLNMYLNGQLHQLQQGDIIKIPPNTRHYSIGNETIVYVYATPGWASEDHVLVIDKKEISRKKYDKRF